jgi:hypothetical protein
MPREITSHNTDSPPIYYHVFCCCSCRSDIELVLSAYTFVQHGMVWNHTTRGGNLDRNYRLTSWVGGDMAVWAKTCIIVEKCQTILATGQPRFFR